MAARYSRSLEIQKTHFVVGLAISLLFTFVVAFLGGSLWIWQADIVSSLLSFAGVPHELFVWGGPLMGQIGPTFQIPVESQPIPFAIVIAALIVLMSVIVALVVFRKMPSPVKTVALVISIVTVFVLLWQAILSPIPRSNLHWITIDWSCSGIIGLCLVVLVFSPLVFTMRGPLWAKVFWLLLTVGFSAVWNLVRMSVVTATLYYFGGSVFLVFHYLAGAFIDFVYIVAFYSFALVHLSKFEVSEVKSLSV